MSLNLLIREQARDEVSDICTYYETQSIGLSKRFLDELHNMFLSIQSMPSRYRFYKPPIQYANMKIFPYQIFFEISEEKNTVFVRAVFHQRKHPNAKAIK